MEPQNMNFKVRKAYADEAETLTDISIRSKSHWGYPNQWIEKWRNVPGELIVTPEMIETWISFVVLHNQKIVGFWCRSPIESEGSSPGLLAVSPDYWGRGCGRILLDAVKEETFNRGIRYFTIESDPNSAAFYIKLGAVQVGSQESKIIPGRILPLIRFYN